MSSIGSATSSALDKSRSIRQRYQLHVRIEGRYHPAVVVPYPMQQKKALGARSRSVLSHGKENVLRSSRRYNRFTQNGSAQVSTSKVYIN